MTTNQERYQKAKRKDQVIRDLKKEVEKMKEKPVTTRSWIMYFQYCLACALSLAPISVSIISAIHIFHFLGISNPHPLAVALAASFEFLSITSIASFMELQKLSMTARVFAWAIVILLVALQILGNSFSMFQYILQDTAKAGIAANFFGVAAGFGFYRFISILTGFFLPFTSTLFTKILSEYIVKLSKQ